MGSDFASEDRIALVGKLKSCGSPVGTCAPEGRACGRFERMLNEGAVIFFWVRGCCHIFLGTEYLFYGVLFSVLKSV